VMEQVRSRGLEKKIRGIRRVELYEIDEDV
jgi:hypothetical protein